VLGAPIEVVVADHKNSADRAGRSPRLFDNQHVDRSWMCPAVRGVIVQRIADTRGRIAMLSAPAPSGCPNDSWTAATAGFVRQPLGAGPRSASRSCAVSAMRCTISGLGRAGHIHDASTC